MIMSATRSPIAGPSPAAAPLLAQVYPLRILLTEDNLVNQKVASRLLQRLGYCCDIAANGEEALQALDTSQYDLVLMDVQMPVMDGLEATRRIIQRFGPERRPQIVALTAHATLHDREACLASGMDDYFTKPVITAVLEEKLRAAAQRLLMRARPSTGIGEADAAGGGR